MGDKKRAPARKKSVLLIGLYLCNYPSNFKILKSLTQLGKWATQSIIKNNIKPMCYSIIEESPKMPIFWKFNFFVKNHAVLVVQHLQLSINRKLMPQ
jgi:hypothetical protein